MSSCGMRFTGTRRSWVFCGPHADHPNPISASQAQAYHAEEFGNARENYYTQADQIHGEWHGRLAEQWGSHGEVSEEHFQRLTEGQHPMTGEQLVRHKAAREYVDENGHKTRT